jgi:transcription elongation factor Elf1
MGGCKSRTSKLLAQPKLDTTFTYVDDVLQVRPGVSCLVCKDRYSTKAHHPPTEPVDVYGEWIDACVFVQFRPCSSLRSTHYLDGHYRRRTVFYKRVDQPGRCTATTRAASLASTLLIKPHERHSPLLIKLASSTESELSSHSPAWAS